MGEYELASSTKSLNGADSGVEEFEWALSNDTFDEEH